MTRYEIAISGTILLLLDVNVSTCILFFGIESPLLKVYVYSAALSNFIMQVEKNFDAIDLNCAYKSKEG